MVITNEIGREQAKHELPAEVGLSLNGLYKKGEQIWILDKVDKLKLRILVSAHCGQQRHRAYDATSEKISKSYWWKRLQKEV